MAARLVVILIPDVETERLEQILRLYSRRYWRETVPGRQEKFSCIAQQRYTGRLLEQLERAFAAIPTFTVYVSNIEAVFPPVKETVATELPGAGNLPPPTRLERFFSRDRNSTDEIFDDIDESLHVRPTYLLTVALSSLIAGLGMHGNQTAVVIGAMIIAPLLGPTMGLALATTVGDRQLGQKAAIALIIGSMLAVLVGFLIRVIIDIDPLARELLSRTVVGPADIALALASGAAGVLAFSRGSSLSLVGVMIAVALVPPLSATGIYAGAGYPIVSANALFLFAINLACIMMAGIVMFLLQGLPPQSWRLTSGLLALWIFMLLLLAFMMAGHFVFGLAALETVYHFLLG
jgi:uncharacterized hydrophobic protein (TIGR00341 family)